MTAKPQAFTYASQAIPSDYQCSRCKVLPLKLWRQYNTFLSHLQLLCATCIDPAVTVERNGMHKDRFGQLSDQMTDRIGTTGSLVPAVPTEQADTYWGYLAVPIAGVAWWRALPTYPDQLLEPFRITPAEEASARRLEEMKRANAEEIARRLTQWRAKTVYVVEASDTEHQFLWERYHHMVSWEQLNPGEMATIGHLKKKPLCVDIRWARLNDQIVMFYYPCSTMIDWSWVKNWVSQEYPGRPSCNAANFHNCLGDLRRNKRPDGTDG